MLAGLAWAATVIGGLGIPAAFFLIAFRVDAPPIAILFISVAVLTFGLVLHAVLYLFSPPAHAHAAGHGAAPNSPAISKIAALFVLGLVLGAFSFGLPFLWKGYIYKATDLTQYFASELLPYYAPGRFRQRLAHPLIVIDIGEQTCAEWAKKYSRSDCAALPRWPHDELAGLFRKLVGAKPRLVVVDFDLRTEAVPAPGTTEIKFTDKENEIREVVRSMTDTPFLVMLPLVRAPRNEGDPTLSDPVAATTILHGLENEKKNLRFGHFETLFDDDGVMRRFPATRPIANPGRAVNPHSEVPGRVWHFAVQACELVPDCGGGHGRATPSAPRFGNRAVGLDEAVQFPYLISRDLSQLVALNVKQVEARSAVPQSLLNDAVVILGSTARGRGDYHLTPLDVLGGDTAGVVIVANEVMDALADKSLVSPHPGEVIAEKLALIVLSTALIFFGFWIFYVNPRPSANHGVVWKLLVLGLIALHFGVVVGITILINAGLTAYIAFYSLGHGELADPVTPVIAAILDAIVALCAIIGNYVASWADRGFRTPRPQIREHAGGRD
jgi:CHASE2 domain-containing sensor protein